MEAHEVVYTQPNHTNSLPPDVMRDLDGDHLESRAGEAIRLSTVGPDGWPHAAHLSVGELLAVGPTELLVAIWPQSNSAQNLKRDGRLTMSLVHDGALLEMRANASLVAQHQTKLDLSVFRIKIESIKEHRAKYADVLSGVTFRLHEQEKVFARWREQISALRSLV